MKAKVRESFVRDLKRIRDKAVLSSIQRVIEESENVERLDEIRNV